MTPAPFDAKKLLEQEKAKIKEAQSLSEKIASGLGSLPAMYGFGDDLEAFLGAVRVSFNRLKAEKKRPQAGSTSTSQKSARKKIPNGKVTDEIKAQLREFFEKKTTVREICSLLHLSSTVVNDHKKDMGFVKTRKTKEGQPSVANADAAPTN